MKFLPATIIGLALVAASIAALATAPDAANVLAIAGATGTVLGTGLLALTLLAWRWSAGVAPYRETHVSAIGGVYDDIAEVFDATQDEAAAI